MAWDKPEPLACPCLTLPHYQDSSHKGSGCQAPTEEPTTPSSVSRSRDARATQSRSATCFSFWSSLQSWGRRGGNTGLHYHRTDTGIAAVLDFT